MKPENSRPVAIEDLLRLKRAERPGPEFWTTFDRSLRAKQLSALVEKRPWWRSRPQIFAGISRFRLPLGAGAVVAAAFFSLRDTHVAVTEQSPVLATESVALRAESDPQAVVVSEIAPPPAQVETRAVQSEPVAPREKLPAVANNVAQVAAQAPAPVELQPDFPSGRYVATALAGLQTSESLAPRTLLAAAGGFETRAMPSRLAVEPLQQITPPGDTRRTRLLSAMVSASSSDTSFRTTERVASRIAEDRLYDQVHRFGARGDRLQVKF